jgi:hypothetical protein
MEFINYINTWVKSEVLQGRIMIGIGVLVLIAFIFIIRSENELLRGALIPMGLIIAILIGYGGFILYSRPAHAKASIERYESNPQEAVVQEVAKHTNDNKAGVPLTKYVYPALLLLSAVALYFAPSPYYKGMALGFGLLAITAFIMDSGFVSRSNAFLEFLSKS